jgi:hypothetical protein
LLTRRGSWRRCSECWPRPKSELGLVGLVGSLGLLGLMGLMGLMGLPGPLG